MSKATHGKSHKSLSKVKQPKGSRKKLPKYGPKEEARQLADVLQGVIDGMSQTEIAKKYEVGAKSVLKRVKDAFDLGLAKQHLLSEDKEFTRLHKIFKGVKISIITAKYEFDKIAALHLLSLIREAYSNIPASHAVTNKHSEKPCIAIGGGRTLFKISQALKDVLEAPECAEYREWLESPRFFVTNATAGGQTWQPREEASKIACDIGTSLGQETGIYSVSRLSSKNEKELIQCALQNTFLVISGVGTPDDAQCINAVKETGGLVEPEELKDMVGEFLYHPYTAEGKKAFASTPNWFDVKDAIKDIAISNPAPAESTSSSEDKLSPPTESTPCSEGKPSPSAESPLLGSLFSFESLSGRPAPNENPGRSEWKRSVIGIVKCKDDPDSRAAKAKSLFHLLDKNFFTHVIIPHDLALELTDNHL